jgi:hypothetical protein
VKGKKRGIFLYILKDKKEYIKIPLGYCIWATGGGRNILIYDFLLIPIDSFLPKFQSENGNNNYCTTTTKHCNFVFLLVAFWRYIKNQLD